LLENASEQVSLSEELIAVKERREQNAGDEAILRVHLKRFVAVV